MEHGNRSFQKLLYRSDALELPYAECSDAVELSGARVVTGIGEDKTLS